jgi:hypothetical protein
LSWTNKNEFHALSYHFQIEKVHFYIQEYAWIN